MGQAEKKGSEDRVWARRGSVNILEGPFCALFSSISGLHPPTVSSILTLPPPVVNYQKCFEIVSNVPRGQNVLWLKTVYILYLTKYRFT